MENSKGYTQLLSPQLSTNNIEMHCELTKTAACCANFVPSLVIGTVACALSVVIVTFAFDSSVIGTVTITLFVVILG